MNRTVLAIAAVATAAVLALIGWRIDLRALLAG
jgi:hypothetical protein